MKKLLILTFAVALGLSALAQNSIYDFTVTNQDGTTTSMEQYRGKVLLIVNTATECGFTPMYYGLEGIYEKLGGRGLEVLDFPCNQFGAQAPGSDKEIHAFCTSNYNVSFTQFAKIDVNGDDAAPLFRWLKKKRGFGGFDLNDPTGKKMDEMLKKMDPNYAKSSDIKWNFTRFIIDRNGNVVARHEPTTPFKETEDLLFDLIEAK